MINEIDEKESYTPIKTKQAVMFIVKAWSQVTSTTIENC